MTYDDQGPAENVIMQLHDVELLLEISRELLDQVQMIHHVDNSILGELRAIHTQMRRPATRRAD